MSKSQDMFRMFLKKADMIGENYWKVSTAKRKTLIIPTGFKIYDTDLGITFVGDGSSYGGKVLDDRDEVRAISTLAASAFTLADTFKTIASAVAETKVFTSNTHGFETNDVIIAMSTQAGYTLVADALYTVTKIDANTFTLKTAAGVAVTPGADTTANVVVKLYAPANNNYITWAQAASLRTGDGITATQVDTLPSGITAAKFFVIKDDTGVNGGADRNVTTKFRIASSRANALAGTAVVIRDAGSGANTFVTTETYLRQCDKTVIVTAAVATDVYLPSGTVSGAGATYEVSNLGAANCDVKSAAGTVDGVAAGTGRVLKANSLDFIVVKSDGTNWVCFGKQITS